METNVSELQVRKEMRTLFGVFDDIDKELSALEERLNDIFLSGEKPKDSLKEEALITCQFAYELQSLVGRAVSVRERLIKLIKGLQI